ncbi:E3 ubiquitin-protein ligase TRIM56-like [Gigantopelta aegis]|uniref:E3 ubiquitin-protein ligase TRIM56-like n=1 Tax=Gigantopelta aegis TaxID=1735272 RepID=UPI001B889A8C|nr:E3 ubiquitin-protein ligase TRIM56-like [Gigantopelta aegis]
MINTVMCLLLLFSLKKMASKGETSVTRTICEDFLTCNICFNIYDRPKILPCVQTYCSPCLEKLMKTSTKPVSVLCPECREHVVLPKGTVCDLKANLLINGLIDVLKAKTDQDIKCTTCNLREKISLAKSRCLDCGDYLCPSCSGGHNASSTTWNHKVVLMEELKGRSYDKELRNVHRLTCSEHKDKIEYFCEVCQIPICLACNLFKHRDHTSVTVSEAVAIRKRRLVSHAGRVRQILQEFETENRVASSNFLFVKRNKDVALSNIEDTRLQLLAKVQYQKGDILHLLNNVLRCEKTQYQSLVENIGVKISLATSCMDFCYKIIEDGRDEEIMYLEQTVTKRLHKLAETPYFVVSSDETLSGTKYEKEYKDNEFKLCEKPEEISQDVITEESEEILQDVVTEKPEDILQDVVTEKAEDISQDVVTEKPEDIS